ncbi:MAG: two-component system response regulator [Deltaproteobacteria bacterium HGW-Deltaproteobacteria-14]|nr:MAG: two-component system response regulator [Deltaproteobacteria bacterium HGW-Deltaproteobacteria-14]
MEREGKGPDDGSRLYFERNPLPMWVHDVATGRVIDVNAAALAHYGHPRAAFLELCADDIVTPGSRSEASSCAARGRHRRADGSVVDVDCACDTVALPNGVTVRLVVIRDGGAKSGEQRRVEQSERNLKRILEAIPVGIWLFDAHGQPVGGNLAARAIWGGDIDPYNVAWRERINARSFETGEPLPLSACASIVAIEERRPSRGELVSVTTLDGRERTLVIDAIPLEDEEGGPAAIVVNHDVTRLIIAERQARQLEHVLASSADATAVVAADGTVGYVNPAVAALLGDATSARVGQPFPWPLGDAPSFEVALPGPDGEVRAVELRVTSTVWERAPAHLVVLRDVTAHKRVARSLLVSERALQASSNGVVVIIAGPEVAFASTNPAFERLTGFSEDEVVGRGFDVLLGGLPDKALLDEINSAVGHGRESAHTFQGWRKDGASYWCELRLAAVRDEAGRVTHAVGIMTDVSDRRRFELQLAHQASHDALTGLPNRDLALDRLRQAIDLAARLDRMVGVIVLDLDEFKVFNDAAGHTAGDSLLRQVSRRLRGAVRRGDTVARLGGDEFVILCPNLVDETELDLVGSRLTVALAAPFTVGEQARYVTASLGVSAFPVDADEPEVLLTSADIAMYQAKADGRNTLRRFQAEMNARLEMRFNLDVRLREALDHGEFELFYQPQVDARSGRVCGAEALIRWRHPERGLVPPLQFIPIAEESGLIVPIGRWALEQACRQNRAWQETGLSDFPVAVNVSVAQFRRSDLVATVAEVLAATGLSPRMLELELTESLGVDNADAFIATLADLRRLGVSLAIDDFGTGYSSLNYLRRLPVTTLKIDRTFVREVHTNPGDAGLARSIIAMAHNLGLSVVAEGVETEAQAAFLRRNMCDVLQGYLYARPMPASELEVFLQRSEPLFPTAGDEGDRTVLLVDDEPLVSRAIGRMLVLSGYEVLVASSGPAALELMATRPVGVIISDQRMPGMRGIELLRRVKDLHPLAVRLILSGQGDYETIQDAINQGAIYKYLLKPCSEDVLKASVAEAFQHHDLLSENQRLREKLSRADTA